MMEEEFLHDILATGPDLEGAARRILAFLDATPLVRYQRVAIDRDLSMNGLDGRLLPQAEASAAENRQVLDAMLTELRQEGVRDLADLARVEQGFQSKLFHVIAHILDGFFGIDSRFYDLDENSHWLTGQRRRLLSTSPEQCWLIRIRARLGGETDFAGRKKRFSAPADSRPDPRRSA